MVFLIFLEFHHVSCIQKERFKKCGEKKNVLDKMDVCMISTGASGGT